MSRENYIRVETRLIASLQRAGYTNDLGLLYKSVRVVKSPIGSILTTTRCQKI